MAHTKAPLPLGEEALARVKEWAACGYTHAEIAAGLGVSVRGLHTAAKHAPALAHLLATAPAAADMAVVAALHKKAVAGDVRAITFWLKNRQAAAWAEKPAAEQDDALAAVRALVAANEAAAAAVLAAAGGPPKGAEGGAP